MLKQRKDLSAKEQADFLFGIGVKTFFQFIQKFIDLKIKLLIKRKVFGFKANLQQILGLFQLFFKLYLICYLSRICRSYYIYLIVLRYYIITIDFLKI